LIGTIATSGLAAPSFQAFLALELAVFFASHPFETGTVVYSILLLLGVGIFAQTSTPLSLITAGGATNSRLANDLVNPAAGALTEIAGSPFGAGINSNGMAMNPQKRFLYVATGNGIAGFRIDGKSGGLTTIDRLALFLRNGKFLYAPKSGTDNLGFRGRRGEREPDASAGSSILWGGWRGSNPRLP
jgi:hypothetical protein